jgi:hypothetical protein
MKSLSNISLTKIALAYDNNMGFTEMVQFYQIANEEQISQLEQFLRNSMFTEAWQYLQEVTNTQLKGTPQ